MIIGATLFYCSFLIVPSFLHFNNNVVSKIQTKNQSNVVNPNNRTILNFLFNSTSNNQTNNGSGLINPYKIYKSEPAPMGMSDYGINPITNKSYAYNTTSFLGIAKIYSLNVISGQMKGYASIQLNAILKFSAGSLTYVYFLQNVAAIYAIGKVVSFTDNVWNVSKYNAIMNTSVLYGKGHFFTLNSTTFYYCQSGHIYSQVYPTTLQLKITSFLGSNGLPSVAFEFKNGNGNWTTYDEVSFRDLPKPLNDMNLVVNGSQYGPCDYLDAEFILGSIKTGTTATDQSNTKIDMLLEYYNNDTYHSVPYAYNFGSNTQENVSNIITKFFNNTSGSPYIELMAGSGKYLGPVIFIPNQTSNLWLTLEIIGVVAIGVIVFLVLYFSLKHKKKLQKLKKAEKR